MFRVQELEGRSQGFVRAIHARHPKRKFPSCGSVSCCDKGFILAESEDQISCQRCLRKLGLGRFKATKKLYDNFQDFYFDFISDPARYRDNIKSALREAFQSGFIAGRDSK